MTQPTAEDLRTLSGLFAQGRYREMEAAGLELARRIPGHGLPWLALGTARARLGRNAEAIEPLRKAAALYPHDPIVHFNLAGSLQAVGRLAEAEAGYRRALELRPRYPEALCNLGNTLLGMDRFAEAEPCYRRALELAPGDASAHANLGIALLEQRRLEEAEASFRTALALDPALANAHANLGMTLLLGGKLEAGWPEFEWRWRDPSMAAHRRDFGEPWRGQPLAGRTLLLHAEQGFGDTLQFCRYAARIARPAQVVLEVQPALVRLLSGLEGVDRLVARGDPLPAFDAHCPLLSLPLALGTRMETIPAQVPYLRIPQDSGRPWLERLGDGGGLKVGLAWSGRPDHRRDRQRSLPPALLAPFAAIPGARLFSLQKGGADAAEGLDLVDFTAELEDFADTAALVAQLDLVVTIDTAVAHLAGALGKPAWVLLPFVPDWRWGLDREDSPWYPTLRLFRQTSPGDWSGVVARVAQELAAQARRPRPT